MTIVLPLLVMPEPPPPKFGACCDDAGHWPLPGQGATVQRWRSLAAQAQRDVVLGRLVEAHSDADAILHELTGRRAERGTRYGVWAARAPGHLLSFADGRLTGSKAWCSGSTLLTHALVTAESAAGEVLVEVELGQPEVQPAAPTWAAAGMRGADTRQVAFHEAPAREVEGDYLKRPGFWMGAIGVAACWYGGAAPLVDPLAQRVSSRADDAHAAAHLGAAVVQLGAARAVLHEAAAELDAGRVSMELALRVRATVADAVTEVARRVGRALGPQPYASDQAHARRLADLEVYVRQDHAERDLAVLGAGVAELSWEL